VVNYLGYDRFRTETKEYTCNDKQATIVRTIFNWYIKTDWITSKPINKNNKFECIKLGYHPYTHSKRNVKQATEEQGYMVLKQQQQKRKNPKFD
jgi:hypothetical protein